MKSIDEARETFRRVAALAADKAATSSERAAAERVMRTLRAKHGDKVADGLRREDEIEKRVPYGNAWERDLMYAIATRYLKCQSRLKYKQVKIDLRRKKQLRPQLEQAIYLTGPADIVALAIELFAHHRKALRERLEYTVIGYVAGAVPLPDSDTASADALTDNQLAGAGPGYDSGVENRTDQPLRLIEGAIT